MFELQLPDGSKAFNKDLPPPTRFGTLYKGFRWVEHGVSEVGYKVFILQSPPFNITFLTDSGEVTYRSDALPPESELPLIPTIEGKKGVWDIPRTSVLNVTIKPRYEAVLFTAKFIGINIVIPVQFSISKPLVEPSVPLRNGYKGKWSPYKVELRDFEIHAEYEPIEIVFIVDGKKIYQTSETLNPPELVQTPGYDTVWDITYPLGYDDMVLEPKTLPIEYHLTIHEHDSDRIIDFTIESVPDIAPPVCAGYRCRWDRAFDFRKLEDQEIEVLYEPIFLRYHFSDTLFFETRFNDGTTIPAPRWFRWPPKDFGSDDVDLYPVSVLAFALFYSNGRLIYCVPFKYGDYRHLDEVLKGDTVPPFQRRRGVWVERPTESNYLIYEAEYGESFDNPKACEVDPRWVIGKCPDGLIEYGTKVNVGGMSYDLLRTAYSAITGITRENIQSLRSLPLEQWLSREGISYSDTRKNINITEYRDRTVVSTAGRLRISFEPRFQSALDFLKENNVEFVPSREKQKQSNIGYLYLINSVEVHSTLEDAEEDVWPSRLIPSRKLVDLRTSYYKLGAEEELLPRMFSKATLDKAMRSGDRIIELFEDAEHPECEFDDLGDGSIELIRYNGADIDYMVPEKVLRYDMLSVVTSIGPGAFTGNERLESVVVPESVVTISSMAFSGCIHLSDIEIRGVPDIADDAFDGCSKFHLEGLRIVRPQMVSVDIQEGPLLETNNESADSVVRFVKCLSIDQRRYLEALLTGEDTAKAVSACGRAERRVKQDINGVFMDMVDEDGLFDEDGDVLDDYAHEITVALSEDHGRGQHRSR